ncbi:MAG: DNA alkylation repair protein [Muribaculaceae bacterium]|nr:DNA alkylation repair protein [Muribaculaceae bacterium]
MNNVIVNEIKQRFFAYRNGVVASALRKGGAPHKTIMGCQIADVTAIANEFDKNAEVARALWDNLDYRECQLAAIMLYRPEEFDYDTAKTWCVEVKSLEVADVLAHRLLKHCGFATELVNELLASTDATQRYLAFRLMLNLLISNRVEDYVEWKGVVNAEHDVAVANGDGVMAELTASILEELL